MINIVSVMDTIKLRHRYTQSIFSSRVAILGIMPPPYGGVSVHIKRTKAILEKQGNRVRVCNTEPRYRYKAFLLYKFWLAVRLLWFRPSYVIYHSTYLPNAPQELQFLCRIKKVIKFNFVFVEHDCKHLDGRSQSERELIKAAMRSTSEVIFIGSETREHYHEYRMWPRSHTRESPFLPPQESERESITANYPPELYTFMASCEKVILVNAFQLRLTPKGEDLYGIDQAIKLLHGLKEIHPRSGLIIALGQIGNAGHYRVLTQKIAEYELDKQVYFFVGQKELWPVFDHVDLFIRPTLWDSFGISVAEAIHFKVPAVASDVCERPVGTIMYESGNSRDLLIGSRRALLKKVQNDKAEQWGNHLHS